MRLSLDLHTNHAESNEPVNVNVESIDSRLMACVECGRAVGGVGDERIDRVGHLQTMTASERFMRV